MVHVAQVRGGAARGVRRWDRCPGRIRESALACAHTVAVTQSCWFRWHGIPARSIGPSCSAIIIRRSAHRQLFSCPGSRQATSGTGPAEFDNTSSLQYLHHYNEQASGGQDVSAFTDAHAVPNLRSTGSSLLSLSAESYRSRVAAHSFVEHSQYDNIPSSVDAPSQHHFNPLARGRAYCMMRVAL